MRYCFYALISLCLIIFQTAYLPADSFIGYFFDPRGIWIAYLAMYRPIRESLIVAGMTGMVVDSLSGGPFGLFFTTYIFVLVIVKWVITYLQVGNVLLVFIIVAIAILLENILILSSMMLAEETVYLPIQVYWKIFSQILCALVLGPVLIMFFKFLQDKWNHWWMNMFAARNGAEK